MPFVCTSCGTQTKGAGKLVIRAGMCAPCRDQAAREHAELADVVPFYDPACAIVLRMEVLLHG